MPLSETKPAPNGKPGNKSKPVGSAVDTPTAVLPEPAPPPVPIVTPDREPPAALPRRFGSAGLVLDKSGTFLEYEEATSRLVSALRGQIGAADPQALSLVWGMVGEMSTFDPEQAEAPDSAYSAVAPWSHLSQPNIPAGGYSPMPLTLAGYAKRHLAWIEREAVAGRRQLVQNVVVAVFDGKVTGVPRAADEGAAWAAWADYVAKTRARVLVVAPVPGCDEAVLRKVWAGSTGEFKVHLLEDALTGGPGFLGLVIDQILSVSGQVSGTTPVPRKAAAVDLSIPVK